MIPAEKNRFLNHPFIGEKWLPIAQVLHALCESKKFKSVSLHFYSSIQKTGRPTIYLQFLSDKTIIVSASANARVRPPLSANQFELMEALGFAAPRSSDGEYALDHESLDIHSNPQFYRLFDWEVDSASLVELVLTSLSMVYDIHPSELHTYGHAEDQAEFVHSLGILDRYEASTKNPKAAIFGIKGSHPNRGLYTESKETSND